MSHAHWRPSGIIALTTDFGLTDPYVGMMKGVILSRLRAAAIVDVTHGVPPQDVRVAAFFLRTSRAYFPPGTVHVVVVDPGVGSERRLCVARAGEQCFLAPDNGVLPAALGDDVRLFLLDVARFALPDASSTFHGRDIFAPAAAAIAGGLAPEESVLRALDQPVRLPTRILERSADGASLETEVLVVDHFGNAILGVAARDLDLPLRSWTLSRAGREIGFKDTYSLADPGEALLLVDSFGAVELAVRDGNAAAALGLSPGDRVTLRRRT